MGLRSSIGRGLNLAGDVVGAVSQAAGAVGQAAGAVGQAGLGLAQAATTTQEGQVRSPLQKGLAVIQGGAAGFAGRPDLAPQSNAEIQAQRTAQNQAELETLNKEFQTLSNAQEIVQGLPKDKQAEAIELVAKQFDALSPEKGALAREVLNRPALSFGVIAMFEGDPTTQARLEKVSPEERLKFLISPEGGKALGKLTNVKSRIELSKAIPRAVQAAQTASPEKFAKALEDGVLTESEFISINNDLGPEDKMSVEMLAAGRENPSMWMSFDIIPAEFFLEAAKNARFGPSKFNERGDLIQEETKAGVPGEPKTRLIATAKSVGPESERQARAFQQWQDLSGPFIKTANSVRKLLAADTITPAGQLSFIFHFMHTIEPGLAVLQGEFDKVQETEPIPDRIARMRERILNKELLGPDAILDMIAEAQGQIDVAAKVQEQNEKNFQKVARNRGVDDTIGGGIIFDHIQEFRKIPLGQEAPAEAPAEAAGLSGQQGTLATEEDMQRISRQIGSTDGAALAQAALAEGLRLK